MNTKRFFVAKSNFNNDLVNIDGIEHNHLKNVLRLTVGMEIIVLSNDEFYYVCEIIEIKKNETLAKIINKTICNANPKVNVTVFQALIKKDNMEMVVQKLNELGVNHLVPFENEFTTVKDKDNKQDKLQNIANQSCKQCLRSIAMQVHKTIKFKIMITTLKNYDIIIFANELEKNISLKQILNEELKSKKIAIIIGSEGGFSEAESEELTNINAKSITLGTRILRAETASIAITSAAMCFIGEWE